MLFITAAFFLHFLLDLHYKATCLKCLKTKYVIKQVFQQIKVMVLWLRFQLFQSRTNSTNTALSRFVKYFAQAHDTNNILATVHVNYVNKQALFSLQFMRTNVSDIFSAGDVTSFPLTIRGDEMVNVGHWQMSHAQGMILGNS